jgi:hypothetical protein
MGRTCTTDRRGMYRDLVAKPEETRPTSTKTRHRSEDIQINLRDIGWCGIDWINVAQDRDH